MLLISLIFLLKLTSFFGETLVWFFIQKRVSIYFIHLTSFLFHFPYTMREKYLKAYLGQLANISRPFFKSEIYQFELKCNLPFSTPLMMEKNKYFSKLDWI